MLPELIFGLHADPVGVLAGSSAEISKPIPKFTRHRKTQNHQNSPEKGSRREDSHFSFQNDFEATVRETAWHSPQGQAPGPAAEGRVGEKPARARSTKFQHGCQRRPWGRKSLSIKTVGQLNGTHIEEQRWTSPHTHTSGNSGWIQDLHERAKAMKRLGKNREKIFTALI